ncbi:MAG: Gfo/Idh/MocA family oxidoreductase [Tepidisphaeraceae bacterium]
MNNTHGDQTRRQFLKTSGSAIAAGVAAELVIPRSVRAAGTDQIKIGLIGAGGRGSGAGKEALNADKGNILWAIGEMFQDRLDAAVANFTKAKPDQVKLEDRKFLGFDAYKKVIESGVDVVVLATPPGFRPTHIKAAIDAGKHLFTEKPMATDVPGLKIVQEAVAESKKKNLTIVAGFCWRYSNPEREIFKRIHDGAIGDIVSQQGLYYTGELWMKPRQATWTDMEWQLRNWLYFTWLSGDHITEQAVHTIDKIGWTMKDASPIAAFGTGGRQVRTDPAYGNIYDHFGVTYEFSGNVRCHLGCRQQGGSWNSVTDHIVGTKGVASVTGWSSHVITGPNAWKYENEKGANDMYQTEHDELFAALRAGKTINNGDRMINSTMMAILGRMAAYTGQRVTWEQAMASKESLAPEKLELGPVPMPPVAMPGKTKLV